MAHAKAKRPATTATGTATRAVTETETIPIAPLALLEAGAVEDDVAAEDERLVALALPVALLLVPGAEAAAVSASVQVKLAPTLASSVNVTSVHWYRCP